MFIVMKALYGLKSSGAAFRAHLAERLNEIGFKSSIADPDVWMRPAAKQDGEEYYEYLLVYVDDILCISHDPMDPMKAIGAALRFKKNKIEPPEMYLGAMLEKKEINGIKVWAMSPVQYIKAAVEIAEKGANRRGITFSSKVTTLMTSDSHAESDGSVKLDTNKRLGKPWLALRARATTTKTREQKRERVRGTKQRALAAAEEDERERAENKNYTKDFVDSIKLSGGRIVP